MIKKAFAVATLLAVACAGFAFAQVKDEIQVGDPEPSGLVFCPLDGYKSAIQTLTPPAVIPDNVPAGVRVGPISLPPDGSLIADVIIDFKITHSWIGDLIASVGYDVNGDGTEDIGPVRLLCRQNAAACNGLGCSANLACSNTYEFSDASATQLGEPGCPSSTTILTGGCYRPSENSAFPLSVFDQRAKGGNWYLTVSDNAGADTGTICEWSVHILNSVTGTENTSWGSVKGLYQ